MGMCDPALCRGQVIACHGMDRRELEELDVVPALYLGAALDSTGDDARALFMDNNT